MVQNINGNSVDDSGPLTYGSLSLCEWVPKFQKNIVSLSSSFQDSKRSDVFHYAILLGLLLLILKCKAVPLQAWSGPGGSRKLRFPDCMTTAQDGGKVVSLTHRPPLLPGNVPGTHFC
jgi:hypothetical protein